MSYSAGSRNFPRFPVFIPLEGRSVLVVGGGVIASRRASVLLEFGAEVKVVSPQISSEMRKILDRVTWQRECYGGLDNTYALVVAATNDREVNRRVGEDAEAAGILCSVADRKEESSFWFPAVMRANGLLAGMVSENGDHHAVKSAAEKIRKCLEECHG